MGSKQGRHRDPVAFPGEPGARMIATVTIAADEFCRRRRTARWEALANGCVMPALASTNCLALATEACGAHHGGSIPIGVVGRDVTQAREIPLYMWREVLDPAPALAAARESASVQRITAAFGVPAVLVTRYADVKNALADHERFSNRKPRGWAGPEAPVLTDEEYEKLTAGGLLGMDPPEHQRLRRLLTPEFIVRRMKNLQP